MSASYQSNNCVIRLRGLPWNTDKRDVQNFLQGCKIEHIQILKNEQGRDLGECFVVVESREDLELAMSFDKKKMSNRYIEIFDSSTGEMRRLTSRNGQNDALNFLNHDEWHDPVVRLRGLPFSATKTDIIAFFNGLHIAQNGVHISSSKPTGEAFVAFTNMDNAHRALDFNRKNMGHRYIEIFKSHYAEARASILNDNALLKPSKPQKDNPYFESYSDGFQNSKNIHDYNNRTDPFDNPSSSHLYSNSYSTEMNAYHADSFNNAQFKRPLSTAFVIEMRGVPYEAGRRDIFDFFYPVVPIELEQKENPRNRTPVWYAEFGSREEATEAMTFHQKNIGKRYVELFPMYDVVNRSKLIRT